MRFSLYIHTYYSLLRTTDAVRIRTHGRNAHRDACPPACIPAATGRRPDMSAFIYGSLRLPQCILNTRLVLLGQPREVVEPDRAAVLPRNRERRLRSGIDEVVLSEVSGEGPEPRGTVAGSVQPDHEGVLHGRIEPLGQHHRQQNIDGHSTKISAPCCASRLASTSRCRSMIS